MDQSIETRRTVDDNGSAIATVHSCRHMVDETFCANCKVRSLAVCSALDHSELRDLDQISRRGGLEPKITFMEEGGPSSAVYTVTEGVARLYKLLPDGRRQVLGFALPGDFLGLTIKGRNGFSVDSVDTMKLCRIERSNFDQMVAMKPHLLSKLHDFATHELVIAHEQMLIIGRRSAKARIAAFLMSMRDRWARVRGPSVTIPLPMPRLDIADYLGLTIETVSRVFTQLAKERVILNVPDGARVLDAAKLAAIAEG